MTLYIHCFYSSGCCRIGWTTVFSAWPQELLQTEQRPLGHGMARMPNVPLLGLTWTVAWMACSMVLIVSNKQLIDDGYQCPFFLGGTG